MARLINITVLVFIITCTPLFVSNCQTEATDIRLIDSLLMKAILPELSIQSKDSLFSEALIKAENLNEDSIAAKINFTWGIEKFRANQFEEAVQAFSKSKAYYSRIQDHANLRMVFEEQGYCFQRLGKPSAAYGMFNADLHLSELIRNDSTIALANTNLGHVEWRRGNFSEAIDFFNKALLIRKEHGLHEEVASSLNSIGSVYWKRGQYAMALKNFQESLKIREDLNDTLGKIISLNNIGAIYQKIEHLKQAEENFLLGLSFSKQNSYRFGEAYSLYNLGLLFAKQDEHNKAIDFFRRSLEILTEIADLNLEMMTVIYLGESHEALNDLDRALEYYNSSLSKSEEYSDSFVSAKALNCIARIYFKQNKNSAKVFELLQKSTEISEAKFIQEINLDNYSLYYQLYQRAGNAEKSLEFYMKRTEIKENLISEKLVNNITDMLIRYEIQESKIEIDLLKKQKELQNAELENEKYLRNSIIIFSISFLIIIVVLAYSYRTKVNYLVAISKQKEQLEILNLELKNRNNELQTTNATKDKLFSLVAHDLRNPVGVLLNYTSLLAVEHDTLDSDELKEIYSSIKQSTETMFVLIDDLLNWAQAQSGTLRKNESQINVNSLLDNTLAVYKNFAALKNINIDKQIKDEIIVIADQHLINSVLRNLVSNALKFTHKNGSIMLTAEIEQNKCKITIADSGIGMSMEKLQQVLDGTLDVPAVGTDDEIGTGLGLNLSNEFLKLHDTKLFASSDVGIGTRFWFYLPIIN